jgi:hypothetical protein
VIAALRRLGHAELSLHAFIAARRGSDVVGEGAARRLEALATALDAAMNELARSFRTLEPPGPIPALRPFQAGIRDARASEPALVGITDGVVDATNTIDAILRGHFGSLARADAIST